MLHDNYCFWVLSTTGDCFINSLDQFIARFEIRTICTDDWLALEEGTRNGKDKDLYQQYGKRGKGMIKKSTIML